MEEFKENTTLTTLELTGNEELDMPSTEWILQTEFNKSISNIDVGGRQLHQILQIKECNQKAIKDTLSAYPDAIKATDDNGMLPLHKACENINISPANIQTLYEHYKEGVNKENSDGVTPLKFLLKRIENGVKDENDDTIMMATNDEEVMKKKFDDILKKSVAMIQR